MNVLTLERIDIEALVLPGETRGFQLILKEGALGIIGGDDAVLLAFCLKLLSNFKD